ncbi:MAG: hydrogenase maturation protease [Fuerstiella sp.]
MSAASKVLIAGIGSMFGDDQAGWIVAGRLGDGIAPSGRLSKNSRRSGRTGHDHADVPGPAQKLSEPDRSCGRTPESSVPVADRPVFQRPDVDVRLATVPLDLLDWLEGVQILHVVDACRSDHPAGTIHRLAWSDCRAMMDNTSPEQPGLDLGGQSTHDFGLADVLRLAEQTRRLPAEVIVWAIDGKNFQLGHEISEDVERVLWNVVANIRAETAVNGTARRCEA